MYVGALEISWSLCALANHPTKTYNQLIELLQKHFVKASTKSLAIEKFAKSKEKDRKSIDEFDARLRHLAIECQYEESPLNECYRSTNERLLL